MALIVLYDPYEWVDPEKGRQGILTHTSIFDTPRPIQLSSPVKTTWPELWGAFGSLPPFVIEGEWRDPKPDFMHGPRSHPYGSDAYQIVVDGKFLIFPTKKAANAYQRPR